MYDIWTMRVGDRHPGQGARRVLRFTTLPSMKIIHQVASDSYMEGTAGTQEAM